MSYEKVPPKRFLNELFGHIISDSIRRCYSLNELAMVRSEIERFTYDFYEVSLSIGYISLPLAEFILVNLNNFNGDRRSIKEGELVDMLYSEQPEFWDDLIIRRKAV